MSDSAEDRYALDGWLVELRRAHVHLDKGEPFFSGKDCRQMADAIEKLILSRNAWRTMAEGGKRDLHILTGRLDEVRDQRDALKAEIDATAAASAEAEAISASEFEKWWFLEENAGFDAKQYAWLAWQAREALELGQLDDAEKQTGIYAKEA